MRKYLYYLLLVVLTIVMSGCEMDLEEAPEGSSYCTGTINAGDLNTEGFKVESLVESVNVGHDKFTVLTFKNDRPQILYVENQEGEPVLLYRDIIKGNSPIEINARTTAIAALTFHPAIGSVIGDDYVSLVSHITSTEHFEAYLAEVEKSIANNRSIYDTSNHQLIAMAKSVYTEYIGDTTRALYESTKETSPLTELYDCWPIDVRGKDNSLEFRLPGCSPSYECKVYDLEGNVVGMFTVPTRGNFDGWDIIRYYNRWQDWLYGETVTYTFPGINEQRIFKFDAGGIEGNIRKTMEIISCLLKVLGLPGELESKDMVDLIMDINQSLVDANISLAEGNTLSWQTFIPLANVVINQTLVWAKKNAKKIFGIKPNVIYKGLVWLNAVEGVGNIALRLLWDFNPNRRDKIEFCSKLYPYQDFRLCSDYLKIVSGNNQTGKPNMGLNAPIVVQVMSQDCESIPDKNYKVRFEAEPGCGSFSNSVWSLDENNQAFSYWILGEYEGEYQYATATLLDENNNEIDKVELVAMVEHKNVWMLYERCAGASAYSYSYRLDFTQYTQDDNITIGPHVLYAYDYDGSYMQIVLTGRYEVSTHHLLLNSDTYDEGGHRTDVFDIILNGNRTACTGSTTYFSDGFYGCTIVMDFERLGDNKAQIGDYLFTDSTSHGLECGMMKGSK